MNQPDIVTLLKARTTLIWITTREELRVERALVEAAARAGFGAVLWDCASGCTTPTGSPYGQGAQLRDPEGALNACKNDGKKQVWIFRDLDPWLQAPSTARLLKTLARDLQATSAGAERALVVLTPNGKIPEILQGCVSALDWPLPDREDVGKILDSTVEATTAALKARTRDKGSDPRTEERLAALEAVRKNGGRETAVDAAVGLTAEEIAGCYARSLVSTGIIDADRVRKDKASVISREKVLEWYEPDPMGLDGVGGLDGLKAWLSLHKRAFSKAAQNYGLPSPRGLLLCGPPGVGKSLVAKSISTVWSMPLLRLDLGALKSKWVGECHAEDTEFLTENGMRKFDDIRDDERLATFNTKTGALEYQLPTARHAYDYEGRMCLVRGRGMLVTPNHRMVVKRRGDTGWRLLEAEEAFSVSNTRIPVAPEVITSDVGDTFTVPGQDVRHGRGATAVALPTTEMLELLGYFVADGSTDGKRRGPVVITQQDGPVADRMLHLLNKFGPAKANGRDDRSSPPIRQLHVQSIPLWSYFREHCGTRCDNKKLPGWVLRASRAQLRVLWDALMVTDGARDHRGFPSMSYSTTSPILAEQVQEIAFRLGMRVTVRRMTPAAPRKPLYIVSVTPKNYFQSNNVDWVQYQGRVVCFSVPNGTLVTRREGRWAISGNSEQNVRRAFRVAEAVAPCILWCDEIEKSLDGATSGAADGGVSTDALGTLLTFMQERKAPVFVLATANDVSKLPPELLRKGRFDELFFVDLPTFTERTQVCAATLRRFKRDPENFDLHAVASVTSDFTGAEIAAIVPEAMFEAFAQDREVSTDDIVAAAHRVVPLSRTASEKIKALREWAKGRTRPATLPSVENTEMPQLGRAVLE